MINDKDKLDLTREIAALKKGKKLYIISFSLALLLTIFYALFSSPVYHNEAVIMIEKESGPSGLQGLMGTQVSNLFSLSGLGSSTMDDELVILRSHDCYKQAVSNLGTNRMYTERQGLHKASLYGKSPVIVEASKTFFDTLSTSLKVTIELTGKASAKVRVSKGFMGMTTVAETSSQPLPFVVQTPHGALQFLKTENYSDSQDEVGRKISVQLTRNDYVAESLQKQITMKEVDKKANAVEIDFDIQDPAYGRDMIGSLISSYRLMRRQHKSDQSASKIAFLDKRIELLTNQLDTTQQNVMEYMKDNNIMNVDYQTSMLIRKTEVSKDTIFALKTQQLIHETILNILQDPVNQYQLLAQDSKSPLIKSYNELILQRTEMLQSAKPGNAALNNLEQRISDMRNIVIDQSRQEIAQNKMLINSLSQQAGADAQSLSNMPLHKYEMINNQRDLSLQNNLLVYLLQERENALLSLNSEEDAGFVIDQPYTAKKTIKKKIYIISIFLLFMGLLCPTFWQLYTMPKKKDENKNLV